VSGRSWFRLFLVAGVLAAVGLVVVTVLPRSRPMGTVRVVSAGESGPPSWLHLSNAPLLDLDRLYPGASGGAQFEVDNPRHQAVTFGLRITGLTNDDDGCSEPETREGDVTCGPGGGELQDDLRLSLRPVDDEGVAGEAIATGTLAELNGRLLRDGVTIDGSAARSYVLGYELPESSTNVTQTDRVGFDVEVALEAVTGAR
jgi:hypothetical protein